MGAHRDITLTDEERTAALVGYLFVCLAWACRERTYGDWRDDFYYAWITDHSYRERGGFGAAVCWAMRTQDQDHRSPDDPAGWLSYVEHVVGYRCGPGNGHE